MTYSDSDKAFIFIYSFNDVDFMNVYGEITPDIWNYTPLDNRIDILMECFK